MRSPEDFGSSFDENRQNCRILQFFAAPPVAGGLAHAPFGRALLTEGRNALTDVFSREGQRQLGLQSTECLRQRHVARRIHRIFAQAQEQR